MGTKTIMLVCSAGMSTSLLVTKMQQAAEDRELDTDIFSVEASGTEEALANKDVDVLLLGPQVRFMKAEFEEKVKATGKDIPVEIINMQDYGMVNGEKILQAALDLINT